jgi:hypothetical protein
MLPAEDGDEKFVCEMPLLSGIDVPSLYTPQNPAAYAKTRSIAPSLLRGARGLVDDQGHEGRPSAANRAARPKRPEQRARD